MAPAVPTAAHANPAVAAPAPATPAASSAKADTPKKSDNELLTKLSEKNPVLGAVLTSVVVANPALKVAQGCMGPSCAGFRDFLLRGTVVDMAVAIVLGLAFVELIKAFIACLVTPLFAAIWKKRQFKDAKWVLRGSEIMYGRFINTLLAFIMICLILYYLIALPMMHLIAIQNPTESRRPCPKCLSDVPAGAIKCRYCTADIPISAALQAKMATDPTGEIQAELAEVRENKLSSYLNFRSWMPARG